MDVPVVKKFSEKVAELSYTLEDGNQSGQYRGSSVRCVSFGQDTVQRDAHLIAESLSHTNLLRVHFVNLAESHTLFSASGVSLQTFCEQLHPTSGGAFKELRLPTTEKTEPADGYYLSEPYKRILLGAVKLMQFLHSKNILIGPFRKDNIAVVDGSVRFFDLRLKYCTPFNGEDSMICLENQKARDYHNLWYFIQEIIPEPATSPTQTGQYPKNFKHFMDLIDPTERWKKFVDTWNQFEDLLLNHVVLKSPSQVEIYYRRVSDSVNHLHRLDSLGRRELESAIGSCECQEAKISWGSNLWGTILHDVIYNKDGTTDYVHEGVIAWKDELVRFIRNAVAHMREKHVNRGVSFEEVPHLVDLFFPGFMVDLQCKLVKANLLSKVMAA